MFPVSHAPLDQFSNRIRFCSSPDSLPSPSRTPLRPETHSTSPHGKPFLRARPSLPFRPTTPSFPLPGAFLSVVGYPPFRPQALYSLTSASPKHGPEKTGNEKKTIRDSPHLSNLPYLCIIHIFYTYNI